MTKIIDNNGSLRTVIYTEVTSVDINVNVNASLEGTVSSALDVDINVTDSLGAVTPDSVSIVGNTITIDVPDAPAAVTRSTATLIKTGQTTSYRTGDDGDLEVGRATDFLTLDAAPLHDDGSATINTTTNRFTDTLGGSTYADNIVLDWSTWNGSTLLGWDKTQRVNRTWNQIIDEALAYSVGTFTTGWRIPNVTEMQSRMNYSVGTVTNYPPFNYSTVVNLWTSTTVPSNTVNAFVLGNTGNGNIVGFSKTSVSYGFYCRTFSLSTLNILS